MVVPTKLRSATLTILVVFFFVFGVELPALLWLLLTRLALLAGLLPRLSTMLSLSSLTALLSLPSLTRLLALLFRIVCHKVLLPE
jgi:hypothetical protein